MSFQIKSHLLIKCMEHYCISRPEKLICVCGMIPFHWSKYSCVIHDLLKHVLSCMAKPVVLLQDSDIEFICVFQGSRMNVETLSKTELLMLLSILEGELEAQDVVIHSFRVRAHTHIHSMRSVSPLASPLGNGKITRANFDKRNYDVGLTKTCLNV